MLFTPRLNDEFRLQLDISQADQNKIERGNDQWECEVTDILTGIKYRVKGAACDLSNCYCDAIVLEVMP